MAVGFKVKFYWYQIGHRDLLHALKKAKEVNSDIEIKSI